jgi:hypothetical protein
VCGSRRSRCIVSSGGEVASTFVWNEEIDDPADGGPETVDRSLGDLRSRALSDQTLKDRVTMSKPSVISRRSPMTAPSPKRTRAPDHEQKITKFVETMRSNVLTGDTPFRRGYIRSVTDQVDDDEIRIWGRKGVFERLVAAASGGGPAGVPNFVRKWRARRDSNSRPPDS